MSILTFHPWTCFLTARVVAMQALRDEGFSDAQIATALSMDAPGQARTVIAAARGMPSTTPARHPWDAFLMARRAVILWLLAQDHSETAVATLLSLSHASQVAASLRPFSVGRIGWHGEAFGDATVAREAFNTSVHFAH